jgi:hypothetical protein
VLLHAFHVIETRSLALWLRHADSSLRKELKTNKLQTIQTGGVGQTKQCAQVPTLQ